VKDQETIEKFVALRAQGWTYTRIGAELGVAKNTLLRWSRQMRFEIQNQRALALDDLQNRMLGSCESRVGQISQKLSRIEEELRQRDLSKVPTARLFSLADASCSNSWCHFGLILSHGTSYCSQASCRVGKGKWNRPEAHFGLICQRLGKVPSRIHRTWPSPAHAKNWRQNPPKRDKFSRAGPEIGKETVNKW
jgi:hypothetical protein